MSFADAIAPIVILLGVLVFIHELGHFLVAKLFDVQVERFSLGFGPALLKRRVGETEYVIAALPLGGYVKMLGELPGEELEEGERKRAFNHKPPWQRIAIALAGPAMNVVLPVFVIASLLMAGIPTLTSRIGAVRPDSPAAVSGLQPGDRIVSVGGSEIWRWKDLTAALRSSSAPEIGIGVERSGDRLDFDIRREILEEGGVGPIGVEPFAAAAMVGVADEDGAAASAGVRTGDRIVAVDAVEVGDRYALATALGRARGSLELELLRSFEGEDERLRLEIRPGERPWSLESLGLVVADFSVIDVEPASPAKSAGLKKGDLFLRVGGLPVVSGAQVKDVIRESRGEPLEVELLRAGSVVATEVSAARRMIPGEEGLETHFVIGITIGPELTGGEYRDEVVSNPFVALWRGLLRTIEMVEMIVLGVAQLFSGSVGIGSLAGPIGIGEIAADTLQRSWADFFSFMAVISVNLAILNLLPIPVLDGGQILLTLAELVRGNPLPERAREMAQALGLSLILVLMGFAFWNDISRNWDGIIGFLKGLV
jgi:regulator of sigma E protease